MSATGARKDFSLTETPSVLASEWCSSFAEALERVIQIDARLRGQIPDVDLIICARNLIVHEYESVNARIIWYAAQEDIPKLRTDLLEIVTQLEAETHQK